MTTGSKPPPRSRQRDPAARRLFDVLRWLERHPWPATRRAYSATLIALANRCEQPAARSEMYGWALREFGGYLMHRNALVRECRADALADTFAALPGTLLRFRAGLDDMKRPHLVSMLKAAFVWRSTDILESTHHRHQRRTAPELRNDDRPAVGRADFTVEANEVLALLSGSVPTARALRLVGLGYSVAEAARRTGASRQQIYRARVSLRALVDLVELDDNCP